MDDPMIDILVLLWFIGAFCVFLAIAAGIGELFLIVTNRKHKQPK